MSTKPTRATRKDTLYVSSGSIGSCAQRTPQHTRSTSSQLQLGLQPLHVGILKDNWSYNALLNYRAVMYACWNRRLLYQHATITSRLYQSGINEQLVMERTDHRSVEGVRSYKRTSDEQRENCGQSTLAVCTGGIAPAHHQHSFNVTEQAVLSAINTSELRSLSIPLLHSIIT